MPGMRSVGAQSRLSDPHERPRILRTGIGRARLRARCRPEAGDRPLAALLRRMAQVQVDALERAEEAAEPA
ncbi:hypothetical protein G6F57_014143 [Rhizopus arrhizus]|uniref:Uncharacterized protein n=1 Tax=Rhizopus delemar TaxID=936053 RepID=A0A9P6XRW6_9FUNG|nr:hypothetical protein G6F31_021933 [Rhizopus arrhizus]KAG1065167.1 hypothetical protein G6F40_017831 [Rhizopus arrhizus]KAG1461415.1 hypothetical protein G6F57_014143 [Rhizopus arrhizus]KAG1531176.1 hypothetical protein G6F50_016846 [Rhizopus delemar]